MNIYFSAAFSKGDKKTIGSGDSEISVKNISKYYVAENYDKSLAKSLESQIGKLHEAVIKSSSTKLSYSTYISDYQTYEAAVDKVTANEAILSAKYGITKDFDTALTQKTALANSTLFELQANAEKVNALIGQDLISTASFDVDSLESSVDAAIISMASIKAAALQAASDAQSKCEALERSLEASEDFQALCEEYNSVDTQLDDVTPLANDSVSSSLETIEDFLNSTPSDIALDPDVDYEKAEQTYETLFEEITAGKARIVDLKEDVTAFERLCKYHETNYETLQAREVALIEKVEELSVDAAPDVADIETDDAAEDIDLDALDKAM